MKKRFTLLVLILFILHAFCAAAEAPESTPRVNENGKKETDYFPDSSFFRNGRFYTVDSLQAGCYPVYKQRILLNLMDKDNDTYERAIDLPDIHMTSDDLDLE